MPIPDAPAGADDPSGTTNDGGPAWRLRGARLSTDRPRIAGILNVTLDSFSDGGLWARPDAAVAHARAMADAGADLIDVGAESTRPGAEAVGAEEEWARLAPVLDGVRELGVPVSVDTTKSDVARRALEAGAAAINDISGLCFDPAIGELAAATGAGLVLMHMRGTPRTMQSDTRYDDVVDEVRARLASYLEAAVAAGCDPEQVVLDPGIGFGKSVDGNLELLARIGELATLGRPIYVGPSRKSFLGHLLDVPVNERVEGTIAACVVALERGACIFRVHDVRACRRALDVAHAIRSAGRRRAAVGGRA